MSEKEDQEGLEEWFKGVAALLRKERYFSPLREKLTPEDDFWLVKEQEKKQLEGLGTEIRNLESAITLGQKVLRLKGQPGWQEFVKSLEDMRSYRRQELELSVQPDANLRILQGRCRELGAILSLVKNTEYNLELLANQLKAKQDERDVITRQHQPEEVSQ